MRGSQFFLFCCVGGVGFIVDLSLSLLLIKAFGVHPLGSRIISWALAATSTFYLNTAFSFRALSRVTKTRSLFFRAFGGYLFSQSLGGAINVMVFMVISVVLKQSLVIGVVMGTISGLIVNYCGARWVLLHGKTRI